MDANLMHISYEGGILEDPWAPPPSDMFVMSKSPEEAPDQPTEIDISFESGMPVAVNGEALSPANLIQALNTLGGDNGIGRIDIVENRFVGMKSRGVYETPGLTILHQAHRAGLTLWSSRTLIVSSAIVRYEGATLKSRSCTCERERSAMASER